MYDNYRPVPIDTSQVVLSEDLIRLIHRLAYNQHELRSKEFIDAGWVFGDSRDDSKHTYPTLMPYEELTDGQKRGDLRTVFSIVKTILALGYTIKKDNDISVSGNGAS